MSTSDSLKNLKPSLDLLLRAQVLVRKLATFPAMARYVTEHKMALINSELAIYDEMLDKGWITLG